MMNRMLATFLGLLALATFASGQLWMQSKTLATSGSITAMKLAVILGSAALLFLSLSGLARMLYRTAQVPATIPLREDKNV